MSDQNASTFPFEERVEKQSPVPLYYQIENLLQQQIREGAFAPGDQLPTEKDLCEHFQVSRSVIRPALQNLVHQGLIERIPGKGTFVAQQKVRESLIQELLGFHEDTLQQSHQPGTKILEQRQLAASPELAALLEIPEGERILYLKRLRSIDGEPHLLSETYLRLDIQPQIAGEDFNHSSLYDLLENRYGLTISHGTRIVEAGLASKADATLLGIGVGSPLLLLSSLVYLQDGRPIEHSLGKHRGDRARFEVDLIRTGSPKRRSRTGASRS